MVSKLFEGNLAVETSPGNRELSRLQGGLSESRKRLERIKQMSKALLDEADLIERDYASDGLVLHLLLEIEESRRRSRKVKIEINQLKKKTQSVLNKLG